MSGVMDLSKSILVPLLSALLGVGSVMACGAATPAGAPDANLAQAKSRAAQGAAVYDRACASCHGPRGEGLAGAPPVLGATALPRYPRDSGGLQVYQDPEQVQRQAQLRVPGAASRQPFITALDVQNFLKLHMSMVKKPAGIGELTEDDRWGVVNFLLIAYGSDVPAGGISPDNASSVLIRAE